MKNFRYILSLTIISLTLYAVPLKAQSGNLENSDSTKTGKYLPYYAALGTSAYYTAQMLVLQKIWYKDRQSVPFHYFNDNKGYLQVDKFGHAFGAYFQSYIGYHGLRNLGIGKTDALIYGGILGLILQTPIEIMDGIHEGWGFSWGDMAANATGSLIVIGQELLFNEQVVKFKFSYSGSPYADMVNGYYGKTKLNRILKDYNGQTYWLSMPVNKIIPGSGIPSWLNIAAGYGANGMLGEFENMTSYNGVPVPQAARYRQYLLSLDIDWSKIQTDSKLLRAVLDVLTFVKLPFPAVEFNSMGKVRGYWIYF